MWTHVEHVSGPFSLHRVKGYGATYTLMIIMMRIIGELCIVKLFWTRKKGELCIS